MVLLWSHEMRSMRRDYIAVLTQHNIQLTIEETIQSHTVKTPVKIITQR